ncbi:MAG: hypothetical protein M3619_20415 [Myxococcota bacterium]|nr:hypothetical protein [Myxococcota bacterium]
MGIVLFVSTTKSTHVYGWPDVMRTAIAAQYIGGSRWMILRAVEAGQLAPAGKRGRSFTFTKESLDRFLIGERQGRPVASDNVSPRARATSVPGDALDRLAALRRGAR